MEEEKQKRSLVLKKENLKKQFYKIKNFFFLKLLEKERKKENDFGCFQYNKSG